MKQRIKLLEKLIEDCNKIPGFNREIIASYKREKVELEEQVNSIKRIYVRQRR